MKIANINGAKALVVEYESQKYFFLFNGAAMFEIDEKYGLSDIGSRLNTTTKDGLEVLGDVCTILSAQGSLARNYIGLPLSDIFDAELLKSPLLTPAKLLCLSTMCTEAITLGYGREVEDDDEEIDLGLQELQKKSV